MRKKLDDKAIINDYNNGLTWDQLCEKYNTNTGSLFKVFKRNNVQKTRVQDNSWSTEKQELLKIMYLRNDTYQDMYQALNCKGGTLTYWVKKLGLPMRGSGRNSTYPNKFLENTIESNYWLGYIFADGHIECSKRKYAVQLTSKDQYVIDKFKEWYDNIPNISSRNYTLKDGTVKTMYTAHLNSKDITLWFKNELKIDSKKHHTLDPNIELNWDIIRGYFDGDGTSAKKNWSLSSCSKVWLKRIQDFLKENNIESKLTIGYKDCYKLSIWKKEELAKIIPLMYQNNYFCHEYKYKNVEHYMSNHIENIG